MRVGEHNLSKITDCDFATNFCSPPVQDIFAQDVMVHPDYKSKTLENVIALIRLATPINFNHGILFYFQIKLLSHAFLFIKYPIHLFTYE